MYLAVFSVPSVSSLCMTLCRAGIMQKTDEDGLHVQSGSEKIVYLCAT